MEGFFPELFDLLSRLKFYTDCERIQMFRYFDFVDAEKLCFQFDFENDFHCRVVFDSVQLKSRIDLEDVIVANVLALKRSSGLFGMKGGDAVGT